jgi:hypothetical protein
MTAVTSTMRSGSRLLTDAPLPAPGAVTGDAAQFLDAKQRRVAAKRAAKSAAAAASIAPTITIAEIAFVTAIKGVCNAGVTFQTTW